MVLRNWIIVMWLLLYANKQIKALCKIYKSLFILLKGKLSYIKQIYPLDFVLNCTLFSFLNDHFIGHDGVELWCLNVCRFLHFGLFQDYAKLFFFHINLRFIYHNEKQEPDLWLILKEKKLKYHIDTWGQIYITLISTNPLLELNYSQELLKTLRERLAMKKCGHIYLLVQFSFQTQNLWEEDI